MTSLKGKVAVITGSSRGLGFAIAETYAQAGASVVLAARSSKTVVQAVDSLRAKGYTASGLTCDVSALDQVRALAEHAVSTFGRIDIWVNNAGISGIYGPTAHIPVERFEQVLRTNIFGTYYGSVIALEHFVRQGSGKLINLLGRGDNGPVKFQNAYASSKYWVKSFTMALAQEYKATGVGIYAFNPGLVDTEMLRDLEAVQSFESKLNPLKTVIRLWANPPTVPAQKALWLASSATDGKTGLYVNVLGRQQALSGLLRDLMRRITRTPAPDTTLHITSITPNFPLPEGY
ncbi:MAG: SDR family oxidoreductase [Anaerolineae bacterium]|nr:SDR family oxidoreductase [Anaerolineae bacterium]